MTTFEERVQGCELLLVLLIHIVRVGTFHEEPLGLLNVFEELSLASDINQVYVLPVLPFGQNGFEQAFGIVKHMKATHATFMLLKYGNMLYLTANGVRMELDSDVSKCFVEFDWRHLH